MAREAGATTLAKGERPTLQREWRAFISYLVVMDGITILFSLWLAHSFRISSGLLEYYGPENVSDYRLLSFYSLPIWLALFAFFGLYRRDNLLGGIKEYQLLFKAGTGGVIAIVLLSFLWRDQYILVSRGWLMAAWALSIAFLLLQRFLSRRIGYGLRRRGRLTNRVLLVGANDQGLAMAQQWTSSPSSGIEVVGFLDDFKAFGTDVGGGVKVLGRPRNLHELVGQYDVDEVVVVPNAIAWETFEEIIVNGNCDGDYTMRLSPGFYEIMSTSVAVTNRQFVPLLTVHDARLVGADAAVKAALDYGLGVPMLLLTLPFLGLLTLFIKLADRDLPIFSRSPVLLPDGAVLNMLRFRTRRSDGSLSTHGRWLEQTEFDRALADLPCGRRPNESRRPTGPARRPQLARRTRHPQPAHPEARDHRPLVGLDLLVARRRAQLRFILYPQLDSLARSSDLVPVGRSIGKARLAKCAPGLSTACMTR